MTPSFIHKYLAITLLCLLLSGCLYVKSPKPGAAIPSKENEALVFGNFQVLCFETEVHPWAVDLTASSILRGLFGPDISMFVDLYAIEKRRRTINAGIKSDDSFYWVLPKGTYLIFYNPRALGSADYKVGEIETIAAFQIPAGRSAYYLGTLRIERCSGGAITIVDEFDTQGQLLMERYPELSGQAVKNLMVYDYELGFRGFSSGTRKDWQEILGRHGINLLDVQ